MNLEKNQIGTSRKRLQQYKSSLLSLKSLQKETAVGLCLGDASLQKNPHSDVQYRLKFEYGEKHQTYAFHIYHLFEEWILSPPRLRKRIHPSSERIYTTCQFQTLSHSAFQPLAELFLDEKGKKCIPKGLIQKHLTERGLAFWYMDDGSLASKGRFGTHLHTQGFQKAEVDLLCQELSEKFGFSCWPKKNKKGHCIVISGKSYFLLESAIRPWVIESMQYKLPFRHRKEARSSVFLYES